MLPICQSSRYPTISDSITLLPKALGSFLHYRLEFWTRSNEKDLTPSPGYFPYDVDSTTEEGEGLIQVDDGDACASAIGVRHEVGVHPR